MSVVGSTQIADLAAAVVEPYVPIGAFRALAILVLLAVGVARRRLCQIAVSAEQLVAGIATGAGSAPLIECSALRIRLRALPIAQEVASRALATDTVGKRAAVLITSVVILGDTASSVAVEGITRITRCTGTSVLVEGAAQSTHLSASPLLQNKSL